MIKRLILTVFLALLVMAPTQSGKRFVAVVSNWGVGMTPVIAPWATPQTIAFSKNMISSQPNGINLRPGYAGILPDPAGAALDTTTAVVLFSPVEDSAYLIYTAGGVFYANQIGKMSYGAAPGVAWRSTLGVKERINPYTTDAISVTASSKLVQGDQSSAKFIRDVMVGDTINGDTTSPRVVTFVYSDTRLYVDVAYQKSDIFGYTLTRGYTEAGGAPYLHQSGRYVYAGNVQTPAQIIYDFQDQLYLRELGIVDSFFIDTFYNFSGRISLEDTIGGVDTTAEVTDPRLLYHCGSSQDERCVNNGLIDNYRTWDTTRSATSPDSFNVFLRSIQVVSRRKSWLTNEWRQASNSAPESFFVRLGPTTADTDIGGHPKYFSIAFNDDSSLFLSRWVVDDTVLNYTKTSISTDHWRDSLFLGRGLDLTDTLASSKLKGTWGYIYATAGAPEIIVHDTGTITLTILGRGAMCYTIDATLDFDSVDAAQGMHFIRLTADDISFGSFEDQLTSITDIEYIKLETRGEEPKLADDDSLLSTRRIYAGASKNGRDGGADFRPVRVTPWFYTEDEARQALDDMGEQDGSQGFTIIRSEEWQIRRGRNTFKEVEALYLSKNTTFPISYVQSSGDTTFFITSISSFLEDTAIVTTSNWEIVRARLPRFRKIQGRPVGAGLVGWGDTLASTTISFSPGYQPWRFSALGDVSVGNPSDPLTAVALYDNEILGFKKRFIYSLNNADGLLSDGIGAVGSEAVIAYGKWIFFMAEGGIYRMDKGDFRGYTITKISEAIEPILQGWNTNQFSSTTVPIRVKRESLKFTKMAIDIGNNKLWVWVSTQSNGGTNIALTYSLDRKIWDGYQTIPVGGVGYITVNDTNRIVFGSVDSAYVFGLGNSLNDNGSSIDGIVSSSPFVLRDDQGRKVTAKLISVGISTRSLTGAYDSAYVIIKSGIDVGSSTPADTFYISASAHNATGSFATSYYRPKHGVISNSWVWEFIIEGGGATNMFQPIEIELEWLGVEDRK